MGPTSKGRCGEGEKKGRREGRGGGGREGSEREDRIYIRNSFPSVCPCVRFLVHFQLRLRNLMKRGVKMCNSMKVRCHVDSI